MNVKIHFYFHYKTTEISVVLFYSTWKIISLINHFKSSIFCYNFWQFYAAFYLIIL
jgi:hypothetical protein